MRHLRSLASIALWAVAGCASSTDETADPRALTRGTWHLSSCTIVAATDPTRSGTCGPGQATRLDVSDTYAFTTTTLVSGAGGPTGSGRFLLDQGQVKLAWTGFAPSGTVALLPGDSLMTWAAATDAYVENPHELVPAVVTIIWARDL